MEKLKNSVILPFILCVAGLIYMLTPLASEEFEVGAYYLKIHESNDPFEKTSVDTIRILDRKGVHYKYVMKPQGRTDKFRFYDTFKSEPKLFGTYTYQKLNDNYSFSY